MMSFVMFILTNESEPNVEEGDEVGSGDRTYEEEIG